MRCEARQRPRRRRVSVAADDAANRKSASDKEGGDDMRTCRRCTARRRRGALLALAAGRPLGREAEKPQYGGTLEIGTVYVDAVGAVVGSARLELEAQPRHRPVLRAAVRGRPQQEQAQRRQASVRSPTPTSRPRPARRARREAGSWKREPAAVVITLRKGIMFPEKPGVMESRELTAEDVVYTFNRLALEPEEDRRLLRLRRATSRPPTSTPSSSTSRNTSPSGTTASAGATTRRSCPRKWSTPAPPTGRTSTAPGRSC